MQKRTLTFMILGLALLCLATVGCKYIMSGTFIIIQEIEFDFTADSGFYWWPVDLDDNPDWDDYQENIDNIDMIGFSFTIENTSDVTSELTVSFAAASGDADTASQPTEVPPGAVTVISGLTVPAHGTETVTYGESVAMMSHFDEFKAIIETGRFDYYGTSTGGSGDDPFDVTDGLLIITLSGSED